MTTNHKKLVDFITGKELPDVGAEANRQLLERVLVEEKGYTRQDIEINTPITVEIDGETYKSRVDLVVLLGEKRIMAIKCAAGSLGSREREILAAARLLNRYQIPLSMVSDGKTAILFDTVSGKKIGVGMDAVPTKAMLQDRAKQMMFVSLSEEREKLEKIIFRSYDSMNVNIDRKIIE